MTIHQPLPESHPAERRKDISTHSKIAFLKAIHAFVEDGIVDLG